MWTTVEIISAAFGILCLLGGLGMLCQGFTSSVFLARVLGDEFLVKADAGTYAIGRYAIRIKESKRVGLALLFGALALFTHAFSEHDWSLAWLIGSLAGAGCARISTQMVPGSILVLGRSAEDTIRLQALLNTHLAPFRAISLLQVGAWDKEIVVKANCFRLGADADWAGAVDTLCALMPLVVLDLRDSTEFVEEEIEIVLGRRYLFKVLFVTHSGKKEPILRRAEFLKSDVTADEIVCVAGETQCLDLLERLLMIERVAPTQTRPIGMLVEADPKG